MIIGLDFDNTMADYNALFHRLAVEQGFIAADMPAEKTAVRDHVLAAHGEVAWQRLQGAAYGPRIGEALPANGLLSFLRACRSAGALVHVVSHKTPLAGHDPTATNLRAAALGWLRNHGIFHADTGLTPERVYFESTLPAKLSRIRALRCDVFVDDLPEALTDGAFPDGTQRILYSQRNNHARRSFSVVHSFADLARLLWPEAAGDIREEVCSRLTGETVTLDERLGEGRNSLVYRFRLKDGASRIAKFYFRRKDDSRDRLKTEYESFSLLWDIGIRQIPQPLMADPDHECAIYSYVPGKDASTAHITEEFIDQAVSFVGQLHDVRRHPRAQGLAPASEACFSVEEIVNSVRRRLQSLQTLSNGTPETCDASLLINQRLLPTLAELEAKACDCLGPLFSHEICWQQRTLSPSDFGFHNARVALDGRLVYLDFEYFGWDDPAKLLSDFLLHPAMSLNSQQKQRFVEKALEVWNDDGSIRQRLSVVYPLFALKWCTILLNEFMPSHRTWRAFAGDGVPPVSLRIQLDRAEAMFHHALHSRPSAYV